MRLRSCWLLCAALMLSACVGSPRIVRFGHDSALDSTSDIPGLLDLVDPTLPDFDSDADTDGSQDSADLLLQDSLLQELPDPDLLMQELLDPDLVEQDLAEPVDTASCPGPGCVQAATTTFTINSTTTVVKKASDCTFCDASYDKGSNWTLLRFQQDGGWIVWSIQFSKIFTPGVFAVSDGSGGDLVVSAVLSSPDLPASVKSQYFGKSGTVNLEAANFGFGGYVAGTIDATLIHLSDDSISLRIEAKFVAPIPD